MLSDKDVFSSREHFCTKIASFLNLTNSKKWGKFGGGIKTIKNDNFEYFSIESYVVGIY